MKRIPIVFGLAALAVFLGRSEASAACAPVKALKPATWFSSRAPEHSVRLIAQADDQGASIVGLWDVQFLVGGSLYDEGLDLWHSDGTEMMNDIPPPASGNVCVGVWAQTGPRTFKLRHPFWIFDASGLTLAGRGTLIETVTLGRDGNSYTGSFSFTFRDLDGNPFVGQPALADTSGDLVAKRITVF